MPEIEPKDVRLRELTGLHLWHAPLSSCSQRVRLVLDETGQEFESHLVNLEKDEHASADYQAIHPNGVVPALVNNGHLIIESIDIIQHVAGPDSPLFTTASTELLRQADDAQVDLKLLTFEFLFRSNPPPAPEKAARFQQSHQNAALKQFRLDFADGFDRTRLDAAVQRTAAGFDWLDDLLSDGRPFLSGDTFSLSDIAWMPNVHRFNLMGWPFDRTPNLQAWFDRVSRRPSYRRALVDWQPDAVAARFAAYTADRRAAGTDVGQFGDLAD